MAATLALSNKQFAGSPHLAALHSNLTRAGYTTNSKPTKGDPMSAYRNSLNNYSLSHAGSSSNLGAALNASGGSMYDTPAPPAPVAPATPKKSTKSKVTGAAKNVASKASTAVRSSSKSPASTTSGSSSGRSIKKTSLTDKVRKLGNSGNNHRVLKAATGAK